MKMKVNVVVLAAGKGTRMYSDTPKVLHELAGKSLLAHCLDTARALNCASLQVVVGHEAERIREACAAPDLDFVLQAEQRGTGHAVAQALDKLDQDAVALVLYGDVPLIRAATLQDLLTPLDSGEAELALLTCVVPDPAGLGRIIRNAGGEVEAIVEEKDASAEQKAIREINTGIMALPVRLLREWLPKLKADNAQGEYYLTDIVAMAAGEGRCILASVCEDPLEVAGVNNREQLALLERHYQARLARELMLGGVSLRDPARFDVRGTADIGRDVEIDVNVILEGNVKLASGVKIGPNCVLKNCEIGGGSVIEANCVIEGAVLGERCSVGPFARLRPGTELREQAKIGNFVETKKALVGRGSKINHLSYVGDSELGEKVNIGAGTITCNYDGANKHLTRIGNDVFIGSNSALVAPVTVEDGATIAAGSTITHNVGGSQLAIARSRQSNKDGWKRPVKK